MKALKIIFAILLLILSLVFIAFLCCSLIFPESLESIVKSQIDNLTIITIFDFLVAIEGQIFLAIIAVFFLFISIVLFKKNSVSNENAKTKKLLNDLDNVKNSFKSISQDNFERTDKK